MRRAVIRCTQAVLIVWFVAALTASIILAEEHAVPGPSGVSEVRLSTEALGVIFGIVALVAPAFYWVGRFNQRLAVAELEVERISSRHTNLIGRGVEVGDRIAAALEAISEKEVTVECHGECGLRRETKGNR